MATTEISSSRSVAYFSMEFGIAPELDIYSGGLGILAGDHLKASSDEQIPMVGVGIFYHHGYFHQIIGKDGKQQEIYPRVDPSKAGIELITDKKGSPISATVPIEKREVQVQAYLKQVGNVPLLLLTTDVEGNTPEDRLITGYLYGASESWDKQTRIRQEMVLGIGGYEMLKRLGFDIGVYHMNEGHSAFLTIARVKDKMQQGMTVEQALDEVKANQLFTTHTPIPAGNDIFPVDVLEREFVSYLPLLGEDGFAALKDRANHLENAPDDSWSQAKFAMATTRDTNAVSRIHSEVTAANWGRDQVGYVTNGVHYTWIDKEIRETIDPLIQRFIRLHKDPDYIEWRLQTIDPEEFRRLRNAKRKKLVEFVNNYTDNPIFDPDVLTIGYGRRAATYKRIDLLFRNPDLLRELIEDPTHPVQIVISAKAHPQDNPGKEMIERVVNLTRDPYFRKHTLFIPDYNIRIARMLVTGSDVWVNTPRKPHEASGTSGMKSGMNGGVQWSVDDGWMNEVPDKYYFKIEDDPNSDDVVAERMYWMLQNRIAPQFYDSKGKPLSNDWVDFELESMGYIIPRFTMARAVKQYRERFYEPMMRSAIAA